MRKEYRREDLGTSIRAKHYEDYKHDLNLVLLTPPDIYGKVSLGGGRM